MIGGFVVGGPGSLKVLVRALGPSLAPFGIQNALLDPTLEVHNENGGVTLNDDWQSDANSAALPPSLQPGDPRESAILSTLAPGNYTAIVRGKSGAEGVALVEVYNLN